MEGQPVGQNAFQQWLWHCWRRCWEDFVPSVVGDDPFILVVNGDLIEGKHHHCIQIGSANVQDHARAASSCLELAAKVKGLCGLFLVMGTECHTGLSEVSIGQELRAMRDPATNWPAFQELWLEIGGTLCNWRHHIGTTSRPYLESSAFASAMGTERIEADRAGHRVPKVMTRAHRHKHGWFEDGISGLGITGAWQGKTRYVHKVVPAAVTMPSVLIYDWRKVEDGELPMVHRRVWRPEAPKIITL
jgi:hypothetical protein